MAQILNTGIMLLMEKFVYLKSVYCRGTSHGWVWSSIWWLRAKNTYDLYLKLACGQCFKPLILMIVLVLDLWLMQLDVSRSLWRKRFSQNSLWLCQAQCPVGMCLLHLATAVEALLLQSPLQSLPPLRFAVVLLQVSTYCFVYPK